MKKILTILIIAFSFISCDKKGKGQHFMLPIVHLLCIHVENASGENLLDPTTEGNILGNEIYIDTNRRDIDGNSLYVYSLEGYGYDVSDTTKVNLIAGLKIEYYDSTPVLSLRWRGRGWRQSDGLMKLGDELLTVNWGDGTSDELKLEYDNDKGTGKITTTIWLNGELYQPDKSLAVTIVK
jgi:hypothetical protein